MAIRIGALARQTHCTVETIRYYEQTGLLPEPLRTAGNYRLYHAEHIERLHFIRHCRALDMSLEEIRVLLSYRDTPQQACDEVNGLLDQHISKLDQQIADLLQLKQRLQGLRSHCRGENTAESCGILQELTHCSCTTEKMN
ncbi:Cd(II)/Pb(II)-responsive transcriptional regulator [Chromatiaceae bacterium AAb-1]|nr:Cd(II)/Pb(II)-responsive transcriptional regulator [Chromatiaceae bacterium AAb-1]